MTIKVQVKYLASLSEALGKSADVLEAQEALRVTDVWQKLNPQTPMKANTICAINFSYAQLDDEIANDAELAFFPPVTGG